MSTIQVGPHSVANGQRCFIIAEAGVNHNGDESLALTLIDAAADAGADAVKFQTFKTDQLVTSDAPRAEYQKRNTREDGSQMDMLRKLELPAETWARLQAHANKRNILFFSSPFDPESADLLETLDVPAFKLGSGELTNGFMLRHVARKGRPLLLSTGMATLGEIEDALHVVRESGDPPVALFHCLSSYPAPPSQMNLRAMLTMQHAFNVPVGYSDHSEGSEVSIAAVAMGACMIEKHFTLDRNLPGPDHMASLEPAALGRMVRAIREVESALGHGRKVPADAELNTRLVARRSLASAVEIPEGTIITEAHLTALRPSTGIRPLDWKLVVGKRARHTIPARRLIAWTDLA